MIYFVLKKPFIGLMNYGLATPKCSSQFTQDPACIVHLRAAAANEKHAWRPGLAIYDPGIYKLGSSCPSAMDLRPRILDPNKLSRARLGGYSIMLTV